MNRTKFLALTAAALMAGAVGAQAADLIEAPRSTGFGGARLGTLTCDIGPGLGYVVGSAKQVDCTFHATNGEVDSYTGEIRKLGVDLGYTSNGRLVWAVFAPTAGEHNGSLAGRYRGATTEVSLLFGAGANILEGGTSGSVHLQLLSVTGLRGVNVAATGTSMTLRPAG